MYVINYYKIYLNGSKQTQFTSLDDRSLVAVSLGKSINCSHLETPFSVESLYSDQMDDVQAQSFTL